MTCSKCREKAVFYESRRALTRDGLGQEIAIGVLSCPACGHEEIKGEYVVPHMGKSKEEEKMKKEKCLKCPHRCPVPWDSVGVCWPKGERPDQKRHMDCSVISDEECRDRRGDKGGAA